MSSNAPSFNTVIQYVVDSDPFLLDYLDSHVLELELCRARGYDYDVLGVARFSLKQVGGLGEGGVGGVGGEFVCPGPAKRVPIAKEAVGWGKGGWVGWGGGGD